MENGKIFHLISLKLHSLAEMPSHSSERYVSAYRMYSGLVLRPRQKKVGSIRTSRCLGLHPVAENP